jgi:hypothetical protein
VTILLSGFGEQSGAQRDDRRVGSQSDNRRVICITATRCRLVHTAGAVLRWVPPAAGVQFRYFIRQALILLVTPD